MDGMRVTVKDAYSGVVEGGGGGSLRNLSKTS